MHIFCFNLKYLNKLESRASNHAQKYAKLVSKFQFLTLSVSPASDLIRGQFDAKYMQLD